MENLSNSAKEIQVTEIEKVELKGIKDRKKKKHHHHHHHKKRKMS
jgi:hypothetical protein